MKRVLFAVICLSMVLFIGAASAGVKDGVWQIYKAAYAPTIDGEMDEIYFSASTERTVMLNQDDAAPPDSYLDLFGSCRMLWDADNLYVFYKVVDDEISSSSANSYENDSIEYFFDGDNSKVVEAFDGVDDVQVRIEYKDADVADMDSPPDGCAFAVADWENPAGDAFGYIIEASFPLASVNIDPSEGTVFGWELQINDRDNEARENMYRWYGISNDAWHWAHIWGEAELVGYTADDVMPMMMASSSPAIDGVPDDVWVDDAYAIESGTYVFTNADVVDASYTEIEDWQDAQMEFRCLWDAAGFYCWVEVIDDEISISGGNAYENDSVELYFDGDNSKGDLYDGVDDKQWRYVWSEDTSPEGTQTYAWGELDELDGYTFELAIDAATIPFPLEEGQEIGFDIQINERDNEMRENMIRWYSSDNMEWQEPWRFGTAVLSTGEVAVKDSKVNPNSFALNQNYPNPFNPETTINFALDQRSAVKLTVYDVLGNEVAQLVNDVRPAGPQSVRFNGSDLSSGVYFYKLETASNVITKKMMLMK
ncbi:T9SS type A sorting domain-containing protein [bacterium]|nr:T9SS type A sorting domain-containing protein [bacterium]